LGKALRLYKESQRPDTWPAIWPVLTTLRELARSWVAVLWP